MRRKLAEVGRARSAVKAISTVSIPDRWPSVATAVRYFEVNAGWRPEATDQTTRLRAYRLPDPRIESGFESFEPFGLDSAH